MRPDVCRVTSVSNPGRVIPLARTLFSLTLHRRVANFFIISCCLADSMSRAHEERVVESSLCVWYKRLSYDNHEHVILDGQMEGRHSPILSRRRRPRISP